MGRTAAPPSPSPRIDTPNVNGPFGQLAVTGYIPSTNVDAQIDSTCPVRLGGTSLSINVPGQNIQRVHPRLKASGPLTISAADARC